MFSFVLTFGHFRIQMYDLLQIIYSLLDCLQVGTNPAVCFFSLTLVEGPPSEGLIMTSFYLSIFTFVMDIFRGPAMLAPCFGLVDIQFPCVYFG